MPPQKLWQCDLNNNKYIYIILFIYLWNYVELYTKVFLQIANKLLSDVTIHSPEKKKKMEAKNTSN